MLKRQIRRLFAQMSPGSAFIVNLQGGSSKQNRTELFAANRAKRQQMLFKVAKMSDNELVENHQMIIRSIVNTHLRSMDDIEKKRAKNELANIFARLTEAIKSVDTETIHALLKNEYPTWFTVQCSSWLFDLYEEIINRLYIQTLSNNPTVRRLVLDLLPNFNKMMAYNRAASLVSSVDSDASVDDSIDTFDDRREIVSQAVTHRRDRSDAMLDGGETASVIVYGGNVVAGGQSGVPGAGTGIGGDLRTRSIAIGDEVIQAGVIDRERSLKMTEKLCFCLTSNYGGFLRSELIDVLGVMKHTEYFDARLIDYTGIYIEDQPDKVSIDVWLEYINISTKAGRSFPYHLIYAFRNRFMTRLDSLTSFQLLKTFHQITKLRLFYFNNFISNLLSHLYSIDTLKRFSAYHIPLLFFATAKSQHSTSAQLSSVLDILQPNPELSIIDCRMIASAIGRLESRSDTSHLLTDACRVKLRDVLLAAGQSDDRVTAFAQIISRAGDTKAGDRVNGDSMTMIAESLGIDGEIKYDVDGVVKDVSGTDDLVNEASENESVKIVPKKRGRPKKVVAPQVNSDMSVEKTDHELEKPKKRGRPKKVETKERDADEAPEELPKKRGRPKKVKPEDVNEALKEDPKPKKLGRPKKADTFSTHK